MINPELIKKLKQRFKDQSEFKFYFELYLGGSMNRNQVSEFFDQHSDNLLELYEDITTRDIKYFDDSDSDSLNLTELDNRMIKDYGSPSSYLGIRKFFADQLSIVSSSCLMGIFPSDISRRILMEGERVISADQLVFIAPEGSIKGRENDPHVTIGIAKEFRLFRDINSLVKDKMPIIVELGEFELFTDKDYCDVLVIKVTSEKLVSVNAELRKRGLVKTDYEYTPHVTLGYIQKGSVDLNSIKCDLAGINTMIDIVHLIDREILTSNIPNE